MIDPQYRVVLTGQTVEGWTKESAIAALAQLFKSEPAKVMGLLSGALVPLKRIMPLEVAQRYRTQLELAGAKCFLQPLDEAPEDPRSCPMMTCPKCGLEQPEAHSCFKCGITISRYLAMHGKSVSTSFINSAHAARDALSDEDLRNFAGPNADVYLSKFQIIRKRGQYAITWHWPACLATVPWMLYRKMYLPAIGAFIFQTGLSIFNLFAGILFGWLMWGFLGNPLYYWYSKHQIASIDPGDETRHAQFRDRGGTLSVVVAIALYIGLLLVGGTIISSLGLATFFQTDEGQKISQSMKSITETAIQKSDSKQNMPQNVDSELEALGQAEDDPALLQLISIKENILLSARLAESAQIDYQVPVDLVRLKGDMQLTNADVTDPWGTLIKYSYDGNMLTFTSAGPDTEFDTDDDIVVTEGL